MLGRLSESAGISRTELRTVAAIGGWTGSRYFSDMASIVEMRGAFGDNVLQLLDANGFDGVDLD
ncbi:hypothetical protein BJ741DRAFT_616345 [Chytriomyces cf. hyalinus JEL632]|nr:hypothetical protein BJ741DRAFT_616345 [Chytriomyces cf. hyalinus JEL632]